MKTQTGKKVQGEYVRAIKTAMLHRKSAVHLELAVGLALFGDSETKSALVAAYLAAGYDCAAKEGADYKTVNRRTNAAKWLFDKLGAEQVAAWSGDLHKAARINAICEQVESLGLDTINAVKAFVGRTVGGAGQVGADTEEIERRKMLAAPATKHVHLSHIEIAVAESASREELIQAAEVLLAMAGEMKAAGGQKTAANNATYGEQAALLVA